jgi:aryl-alcohol dehydrogenase-like predicted oxidoreductase
MKFNRLGKTDVMVSEICLGTMTWGSQNTEAEGHAQIDYALDHDVNFIDTAEMYPTTPNIPETRGRTEEIIGTWFANGGKRDRVVLATKVVGEGFASVRNGAEISGPIIHEALEGSLRKLRTDYVDLYQLHWPNRGSYHFRKSWKYDPSKQDTAETERHILDVLETMQGLIAAGKIRHWGLSNETAWGTTLWCRLAEQYGFPRPVSIQNEYSLMQRIFDLDLGEVSHHEKVGLLAFSPLAAGMLTGKYRGGALPAGSRKSINSNLGGRVSEFSEPVCDSYVAIAERHGLSPAQMGLAFCLSRPFMTSAIIGATTMEQLQTNIDAANVELSDAVMQDIANLHRRFPVPM